MIKNYGNYNTKGDLVMWHFEISFHRENDKSGFVNQN
jgi:hypothetical protein